MSDIHTKVQLYRQKARDNTLTQDEMKEALIFLRQGRVAAAATSATSRAKKAPINSDDLLSELEGI